MNQHSVLGGIFPMLMQSGNPLLMGVGLAGSIMSSLFGGQRQQTQVEGGGVSRGQAPGSSFVGPVDSGDGGQVPVVAVGGEQQNGGQGGDPGRSGNPASAWGQPNRPANPPNPFHLLRPQPQAPKIIPYQNPGPGVYYSGFKSSSVGAQAPQAPANRPGMIWADPPSGQQPPQAPQSKQRVQQPQQQPQQPAKQPQQKVQQPPQQQPVQPRQTQPQKQSQQTQQPRQQPQSAGNAPQRGKANASDLSGGDYSGEQYSPTEGAISGGSGVDTSSVMKQIMALESQISQLKQSMGGDASGLGSAPETSGSADPRFGDNEVYSGAYSEEATPTDPGLESMFSALGLM